MSLSRAEFLRLLPGAVGSVPIEEAGTFGASDGRRCWTLRLCPLADQHVGSVNLPRHRVELRLEGYSDEEAAAFMVRFHRGFLRGGG
ncbi:hypothetical protein GETHLI_03080 [Geothrix limicola]|uniref:Uncharacterized protein n=2 Tax=Geothrix limicola TaxID=2927978 RepID=A0ABQ5QBG6_9BACT|nr:hypothetical protein GETHLI_03080 [Geothrix limicola]